MYLTNELWPSWARAIAAPSDPTDYNEAAVKRLMSIVSPYVHDVKGVRPQFKAINSCELITFDNEDSRERYMTAFQKFMDAKAKIEGRDLSNSRFLILVEQMKFLQAAEIERAYRLAREAKLILDKGKAFVIAVKYRQTIAKVMNHLYQDFNIPREKVSLIWGGDNIFSAKSRFSKEEIKQILTDCMNGIFPAPSTIKAIHHQLMAEATDVIDLPEELDLGPQNLQKRQLEIDNYMSGKTIGCIFSFRAGGVGLSVHHSDDLTERKVKRRDDNKWAIVEDIPNIPTLPRETLLAPTYSAIDLVQGLGRAPRLTSLSDTIQRILFYADTIEVPVMHIVSKKLKCLRHVVRKRESWEDVIYDTNAYMRKHQDDIIPEDEEDTWMGDIESEVEDEDEDNEKS